MIHQLLVVIAVVSAASAKLFTHDAANQGKVHASAEVEAKRLGHIVENLKLADERIEAQRVTNGADVHGIAKKFDSAIAKHAKPDVGAVVVQAAPEPLSQAPTLVDWTDIYTTPVNDEGWCSSSWAFSAVQQIESDAMRTIRDFSQPLSTEQVVQCATTAHGCIGGTVAEAYEYVMKYAGGIEPASAYSYSSYHGTTGTCSASSRNYVVEMKSSTQIGGSRSASIEENMASYVQKTGPISVCLVTSPWMGTYTSGIITSCGSDTNVDACAQIVGVDTSGSQPYWKIRGSWGTSWGEDGFFRLAYGTNACQITNSPTYTAVKSYDDH